MNYNKWVDYNRLYHEEQDKLDIALERYDWDNWSEFVMAKAKENK